jgi:uncharacterized OB-fold protein
MTATSRPIPVPDDRSSPFFAAAGKGQLLIKRCRGCGRSLAPQRETCDACASEALEWAPASGKGTLYSYVFMHQVLHPAFREEVPYNVIVVELDEGPRITSNLVGTPDDQMRVGMRLEAVFEQLSDAVAVPKFRAV